MESLCTLLCLDPFLQHNDFQMYSCWCIYQQSTHFVHCWVVFHSKDWGQEEKGMTEDEMVGWHHWLDGPGFGWTPGVGDGQGGLACCSSWGRKESDTTEWLNWTELCFVDQFISRQMTGFPILNGVIMHKVTMAISAWFFYLDMLF